MHPAYNWGDSYPYHTNHNHTNYAPNDDPKAKEISSHMQMDPKTIISSPYQPSVYGGNYCYNGPQECHGGYNQGYFGNSYGFRPPYPYYQPPPPPPLYHFHGYYPPFPGAYPAYSFPPPHYSVEQPRYDYDKNEKNAHGFHHCCGCNHREDEKKSEIAPKIEKKTSESLAPFLLKDYPYPIMWVPPGFMNNESKTNEKEKHSHDHVPLEHLKPLKKGGNGEKDQDRQGGDDDNRIPFPIFWFPSKNNEVGEKNVDLVANKTSPFSRSEVEPEMGSKPAVQKVIPVKQLETEEEKKSSKNIETKVKSDSMEKTDNGIEGKASLKTSKLPPVCLRIDPLPRKKNGSRSPSPPGDKTRSKGSPKDDSKSSEQKGASKGAGSLADPCDNVTMGAGNLVDPCDKVPKGAGTITDPNKDVPKGAGSIADPCENVPMGEGDGSEKGIVSKAEKKKFSENEAALIIQSASRGFQVRKSKPIMKLRQIGEVGKQVIELKNRIQEVESSSSSVICFDNKQKLVIGETIMSLLLKLDTIQGLHPTVREVRKKVAKELVGLQEKLDSLTSETPIQDVTKMVKDDDGIKENSETRMDDDNGELVESGMNHEDDDNSADSRNTNLESQMELQNEELNNNKQLQVEVDSAESRNMNLEPETELLNEKSYTGRELNNKQLQMDDDDVIQNKIIAECDRNGEVGDIEVDDMRPKSAECDRNGEVGDVKVDGIIAKSAESDRNGEAGDIIVDGMIPRSAESDRNGEVGDKKVDNLIPKSAESDSNGEVGDVKVDGMMPKSAESDTNGEVGDIIVGGMIQKSAEYDRNGKVGNVKVDAIIAKRAESDSNGEVGDVKVDDMIPKSAESDSNDKVCDIEVDGMIPKSAESDSNGEVDDMIAKSAECGTNIVIEEEKYCENEDKGEQDSVKVIENNKDDLVVMDQLVKEQMDVIMELKARVKDLENKLLKNNNSNKKTEKVKKKKKKNKGRRSRACVVEEELN